MTDPIVEKARKARLEHAHRFGFDLDAICEDLRGIQKTCGRRVVSFPPKRLEPTTASSRRRGRRGQSATLDARKKISDGIIGEMEEKK